MEIKFVLGVFCIMAAAWGVVFFAVLPSETIKDAAKEATRVVLLVSGVVTLITLGTGLIIGAI